MAGAGAAEAAKRKARPKLAYHPAYHRYVEYDRRPLPGYAYPGAYPVAVPLYGGGLFGGYPTVDQQYGSPPGGIIARQAYENQQNARFSADLDQGGRQTATGGPVGGPFNSGSGR